MSYNLNDALTFGKFVDGASNQGYTTNDIYNALAPEDAASTERLKAAEEETNNTEYNSLDESPVDNKIIPGIIPQVSTDDSSKELYWVLFVSSSAALRRSVLAASSGAKVL